MKICPERAEDADEIRKLLVDAFGGTTEADLTEALRADGAIVQALVAEAAGEIVGFLALSRLEAPFPACALAPLAVAPLWQRQGIGSALVRAAACDAIFVLGEPEFYTRLGFSVERAAGYVCAYAGPYFMVKAGEDIPLTGRIFYPAAFSAAGSSDHP